MTGWLYASAQTYQFDYLFHTTEFPTGKKIVKDAIVLSEKNSSKRIYKVTTVSSSDNGKTTGELLVLPEKPHEYMLFTADGKTFFIKDFIQEKYYNLEDSPIMHWNFTSESKIVKGVTLHRATTLFRGRNYSVWFKKDTAMHVAPWKFYGIPGIVYEAFDETGDFIWTLKDENVAKIKVVNPFPAQTKFISYKEYPKLRYGLPKELEEALSKNPNRTIFEQPKVDLEIKFDDRDK